MIVAMPAVSFVRVIRLRQQMYYGLDVMGLWEHIKGCKRVESVSAAD